MPDTVRTSHDIRGDLLSSPLYSWEQWGSGRPSDSHMAAGFNSQPKLSTTTPGWKSNGTSKPWNRRMIQIELYHRLIRVQENFVREKLEKLIKLSTRSCILFLPLGALGISCSRWPFGGMSPWAGLSSVDPSSVQWTSPREQCLYLDQTLYLYCPPRSASSREAQGEVRDGLAQLFILLGSLSSRRLEENAGFNYRRAGPSVGPIGLVWGRNYAKSRQQHQWGRRKRTALSVSVGNSGLNT